MSNQAKYESASEMVRKGHKAVSDLLYTFRNESEKDTVWMIRRTLTEANENGRLSKGALEVARKSLNSALRSGLCKKNGVTRKPL